MYPKIEAFDEREPDFGQEDEREDESGVHGL